MMPKDSDGYELMGEMDVYPSSDQIEYHVTDESGCTHRSGKKASMVAFCIAGAAGLIMLAWILANG